MPASARKGAYFLILVSRVLTLGKGEGPAGKCSVYMKKAKNRLKLSFQPVLFGAADEARTRYLHLGKVALYQMSYGRIKKSPKICSVIFLLAAPVRLERTTP